MNVRERFSQTYWYLLINLSKALKLQGKRSNSGANGKLFQNMDHTYKKLIKIVDNKMSYILRGANSTIKLTRMELYHNKFTLYFTGKCIHNENSAVWMLEGKCKPDRKIDT